MNEKEAIEALKSFIGDEDLESLESRLDRNVFESLGLVRQEIRHSAFLRWLLDPTETHGLDYWLRQFLRMVIKSGEEKLDTELSLFDLGLGPLGSGGSQGVELHRLIVDNRNMFVCVIENKVDSGEHGSIDPLQGDRGKGI